MSEFIESNEVIINDQDKFKDECGVFGILAADKDLDVASLTYYGLYALQHRGEESAGIVYSDGEIGRAHV